MKLGLYSIALVCLLSACSSSQTKHSPEEMEDVVLSRADDASSRPSWLKETLVMTLEDGNFQALGLATLPGDDRLEAGYRIAESNARAQFAQAIEQKLEYVFQHADEGTGDTSQTRFIGSEISKNTLSGIRINRRYWERVATTTDSGNRVTRYRIFALATMPEQELRQAMRDAMRARVGKSSLSAEFTKKVDQAWDRMVSESATPKPQEPVKATEN